MSHIFTPVLCWNFLDHGRVGGHQLQRVLLQSRVGRQRTQQHDEGHHARRNRPRDNHHKWRLLEMGKERREGHQKGGRLTRPRPSA